MKNTYYIHDASSGRMLIFRNERHTDPEQAVMERAEGEDMCWNDCSWGGVDAISINI